VATVEIDAEVLSPVFVAELLGLQELGIWSTG
jgi:hypothetical protein